MRLQAALSALRALTSASNKTLCTSAAITPHAVRVHLLRDEKVSMLLLSCLLVQRALLFKHSPHCFPALLLYTLLLLSVALQRYTTLAAGSGGHLPRRHNL